MIDDAGDSCWPYRREPLRHERGIPCFTEADEYVANYTEIAADHLGRRRDFFPSDDFARQSELATIQLLRAHTSPGMTILDVGVARGTLLASVPQLDRYGCDISLDYLEIAAAEGIDVAFARIEDLPYRDGAFDVVCCTDVLEHVLDVHTAAQELSRVVKPGGLVLVRVPLLEDLTWYASPDNPYDYVHLRTFDAPTLAMLVQNSMRCEVLVSESSAYWPDARRATKRGGPVPAALLERWQALPQPQRNLVLESMLKHWYVGNVVSVLARRPLDSADPRPFDARLAVDATLAGQDVTAALEAELVGSVEELARVQAELDAASARLQAVEAELAAERQARAEEDQRRGRSDADAHAQAQLEAATIEALVQRRADETAEQLAALRAQLDELRREQERRNPLVERGAALLRRIRS